MQTNNVRIKTTKTVLSFTQRPQSQQSEKRPPVYKSSSKKSKIDLVGKINSMFDSEELNKMNIYDLEFNQGNEENSNEKYLTSLDNKSESDISERRSHQSKSSDVSKISELSDNGQQILAKAKNLIKQKSQVLSNAQQKMNYTLQKENTFVTGVGISKEEPEPQNDSDSDGEVIKFDFNEEEYLKDLLQQYQSEIDPLEELRKMIKETKANIEDYADELVILKTNVKDVNNDFKNIGKGVSDGIFWDIDAKFQEDMPDFNKDRIFCDDYTLPKIKDKRYELKPLQSKKRRNSLSNTTKSQTQSGIKELKELKIPKTKISNKTQTNNIIDQKDMFTQNV